MKLIELIKSFETKNRIKLLIILRIAIGLLFIFSALAKLFPIELFEKQLVDMSNQQGILENFTNWCNVRLWSRTIITSELFIGISLLIPRFLKSFFIPLSILMLGFFIIHLGYQIHMHGNNGNCGCMGGWLPMSPMSAILKNTITILVLTYLYKFETASSDRGIFLHFVILSVASVFVIFSSKIEKTCCCDKEMTNINLKINNMNVKIDSLESFISSINRKDKLTKDSIPVIVPRISEFHELNVFRDKGKILKVEIDKGLKVIIVANPDCDHCKELSKKLSKLNKKYPSLFYSYFNNPDETDNQAIELQIQNFFTETNFKCPYQILSINDYVKHLGNAPNPPRLVIMNNGKTVFEYLGNNEIDLKKIQSIIEKNKESLSK
jgi:uncharacterized membrane protein YphA (DoxX/SURF4 family)/thiol-disulfide isomerase/thioredoxin